jgi:seryl-tRNA synthetase
VLDIKWIRENPEDFDRALKNRGLNPLSNQLLNLDKERRALQTQLQELQNERNSIAKAFGQAKSQGKETDSLEKQATEIKERLPQLEKQEQERANEIDLILSSIPNVPLQEVPVGSDESANKIVSTWGDAPKYDFKPLRHYELGEQLGFMDFEAAARMSGARFVLLRGPLAKLERAIAQFMLDVHTKEFGYEEISPPLLVRDEAFYGAGLLPKFADNAFQTTAGHWLIPTAEVSLTNIVREQIIDPAQLPLRFTAYTSCFRSEAGAAGKDTRGMIRQHQFYKVELVSITHPDQTEAEHERMTSCAEEILRRLNLHYRKVLLCTGDMGQQSEKTYDLEVWLPGEDTYREISSCSRCGDFQARRMQARFREEGPDKKSKTRFVHTLNGSGLAVGRTLIAILENYQQPDGSIAIPHALQSYLNGMTIIKK